MKKFVTFLALNVTILFVVQYGMGTMLDHIYKKSSIFKTNIIYSSAHDIAHKDILILGGSRGLTGFDSKYLTTQTHKKVFNLATDDTQLPIQLMQLRMLVSRGIIPKILILDLLATEGYSHSALRFMPLIGDKDVDSFFGKYNGKFWLLAQKVFPAYKYIFYNVELLYPSAVICRNRSYQYRADEYGDYQYPDVAGKVKNDSKYVLTIENSDSYNAFKTLCEQNNIRLVSFIEPFYKQKFVSMYPEIINFAPLYDEHPEYFFDAMHLNTTGRAAYNIVVYDTLSKMGIFDF